MYKNKLFLLTNLLIIFYFIKTYYLKINNCKSFIVNPGDILLTNRTYSSWQFINSLKYSSEKITDLYNVKYYNIINMTLDNYILFRGDIVLFNKDKINNNKPNYDAVFKGSLNRNLYNDDFNYNFHENVNMNNEIYKININDGILEIKFLNNCSNNKVLFEENNICYIKNNTYYKINDFLNAYYFNEKFIMKNNC